MIYHSAKNEPFQRRGRGGENDGDSRRKRKVELAGNKIIIVKIIMHVRQAEEDGEGEGGCEDERRRRDGRRQNRTG